MSYADQLFIQNCKDILTNGVWDTDHEAVSYTHLTLPRQGSHH